MLTFLDRTKFNSVLAWFCVTAGILLIHPIGLIFIMMSLYAEYSERDEEISRRTLLEAIEYEVVAIYRGYILIINKVRGRFL